MTDTPLLNTAADAVGDELETLFYAIQDGDTGADQVSNERLQPTYDAAAGGVAALAATLSFTGTGSQAVSHLGVYGDLAGATFRFAEALTGDLAFNANGDLNLTVCPVNVT
jgi:hypothetical protein